MKYTVTASHVDLNAASTTKYIKARKLILVCENSLLPEKKFSTASLKLAHCKSFLRHLAYALRYFEIVKLATYAEAASGKHKT